MDTVMIDAPQLYSRIGCATAPLILDVRREPAFQKDERIIADLSPQSAGLLAASLGLSQRFRDDHEMLENAMPLYDGLYGWCRQEVRGDTESHRWNPAG